MREMVEKRIIVFGLTILLALLCTMQTVIAEPDYSRSYDSMLVRATVQIEATQNNIAYGFLDPSTDLDGDETPDYDEATFLMENYGTPPADSSLWREYITGLEEAKTLCDGLNEYCGYTIGFWKNHEIVIWPQSGVATVAFEDVDWKVWDCDFDYNDFVVDVRIEGVYAGVNLMSMRLTFNAQARGALLHHTQHLLIPANTFTSDGTYTVRYYDASGVLISKSGPTYFDPAVDIDLTIFDDTWEALPPNGPIDEIPVPPYRFSANTADGSGTEPGLTTDVSFAFTTGFPFDLTGYGPSEVGSHGEGLFFDPYLDVWAGDEWLELFGPLPPDFETEVHLNNIRMLIVPVDWKWPQLAAFIGLAYETVTLDPITGLPVFPDDWYLVTPTDYIWTP